MPKLSLDKIKKDTIDYMYADTDAGRHFRDTVTAYMTTAIALPITGLAALGYGFYKNDFSLAEHYFSNNFFNITYFTTFQTAGPLALSRITEKAPTQESRQEIKDDFKRRARRSLFYATTTSILASGFLLSETKEPSPETNALSPAMEITVPAPAKEKKDTLKLQLTN